jgi:hypothetical protein
VSTKDWYLRWLGWVIPILVIAGVWFGWHDWNDHTYLTAILVGGVIAVFEGKLLLDRRKPSRS